MYLRAVEAENPIRTSCATCKVVHHLPADNTEALTIGYDTPRGIAKWGNYPVAHG